MTGSGVCVLSSRRDPDLLAKFGPFEEDRAVRTVCVIVSCTLIYLMNDQAASIPYKEKATQQICICRFTGMEAVVDE